MTQTISPRYPQATSPATALMQYLVGPVLPAALRPSKGSIVTLVTGQRRGQYLPCRVTAVLAGGRTVQVLPIDTTHAPAYGLTQHSSGDQVSSYLPSELEQAPRHPTEPTVTLHWDRTRGRYTAKGRHLNLSSIVRQGTFTNTDGA